MSNLVDLGAPVWRWGFRRIARAIDYTGNIEKATNHPLAFVRGLRKEDLFGAAEQFDVVAVVDALEFATLFPVQLHPVRFDRLRTAAKSYSVEEWRGSPADDGPVFYKILLRGGSQ